MLANRDFSKPRNYVSTNHEIWSAILEFITHAGILCGTLLRRKWFHYSGTLDKGGQCNIYLDELVKGFLKKSNAKSQTELLTELVKQCSILNTKDKALTSFPNFKK